MKLDSFIKFGGLAFDIAQDEKVRTFFTMLHHGMRRRGMIPPTTPPAFHAPPHPYHPAHWPVHHHAIPFSPYAPSPANQASTPAQQPPASAPSSGASVKSESSGTIGSGGGAGWLQQLLELFDRR